MALRNRLLGAVAATALLGTAAQAAPPALKGTTEKVSRGTISRLAARMGAEVAPERISARDRGFALLRQQDRVGALAAFLEATQQQPSDPLVWQLAGDLQFASDNPEGAVRTWEAGVEAAGDDQLLLNRLMRGAAEVGDYARASLAAGRLADVLLKIGANGGEHIDQQIRRNLSLQSEFSTLAGDFTTAEEAARRLIKWAPDAIDGRLALGYMHLQAQEIDDAESVYREVLALEPGNTTALNNLGNIEYLRRDLDAAAARFEAILNSPNAAPYAESLALSNLAELHQLQGGFKGAEDLYRQAIEAQPEGAWGYMGLAALFDVTGRYDQAVDAMIDGWERDSNRMTRLNMHFFQPEWFWQRDALIAEIEGESVKAERLWLRVLKGEVKALHKAAAWHLKAMRDE